ncbi:MAG: transcriptional regulator [Flavobacteriaceae bacterium]
MGSTPKNKKINREAHLHKGYFLLVAILVWLYIAPVFSQQREINKGNLNERILEAYHGFKQTDDLEWLTSIMNYTAANDPQIRDDQVLSIFLYLKACYYYNTIEYAESMKMVEEANALATKRNDIELMGLSWHLLSVLESYREDVPREIALGKALEYNGKAIQLLEETGQEILLIDPLHNQMVYNTFLRRWEEAAKYGEKTVFYIEKLDKDSSRLKHIYLSLADDNMELGKMDKALDYLKKAEEVSEGIEADTHENAHYLQLVSGAYARLYETWGDIEKAYAYRVEQVTYVKKFSDLKLKYAERHQKNERDLKDQLNASRVQTIKKHKWLLILSGLFLLLSVFFAFYIIKLYRRLHANHKETKKLNYELQQSLVKVQTTNMDLRKKQEHITKLMELNERTLFSKVLKISTYNDTIANMAAQIGKLIEDSKPVPPNKLFQMERTMIAMVDEDEIWSDFQIQFEKTRPHFFKKLKKLSPSFSVSELKHCSYVVSQLRTKDVARLINVSPRTVETARYRIKKKLGLDKDDSLYDYLQKI